MNYPKGKKRIRDIKRIEWLEYCLYNYKKDLERMKINLLIWRDMKPKLHNAYLAYEFTLLKLIHKTKCKLNQEYQK